MKTIKRVFVAIIFFAHCPVISSNLFVNSNNKKTEEALAEKIKKEFNEGKFFIRPEAFIENKGQIYNADGKPARDVKFVFDKGYLQIFLMESGISYQFTKRTYPEGYQENLADQHSAEYMDQVIDLQKQIKVETYRMDMTLEGANQSAKISTEGRSFDHINYCKHEVFDVHSYNKITYHEIYPGIDWVIYKYGDELKYDFVVKPGADPSQIKMKFSDQESLKLNKDGSFTLKNKLGSITEKKPISFQTSTSPIKTKFKLQNNTISFIIQNYDASQVLTIDPSLLWATYYGHVGTIFGEDRGHSCATDASGNVYLAGETGSSSNIASGGHQNTFAGGFIDAFLVKFNAAGTRLWATYYGGTAEDYGYSCAADASGNVYLAGQTGSGSNIASGGHQNTIGGGYDAFLAKFNSSGTRLWGTYYGGVGFEKGNSCTTDASGNIILAGYTESNAGIASSGHQNTYAGNKDAFLVKFNSSGTRLWGTYYGNTGEDMGYSCSTDASGNVFLAGAASSTANVASGGHQNTYGGGSHDAFLVKFSSSGTRLWATYYGGTGSEFLYFSCATDASGNAYLAGITSSTANIASGGHQNTHGGNVNSAFLVKFDASGTRLWATYYGGAGGSDGRFCAVDASGNVYLAGSTGSFANIASGGYQNFLGGASDAFLVKFNSSGTRLWGTYYGGSGQDFGNSCSTDASGNIFLAGYTTSTANIASGGHQNTFGGGTYDAFLVKLCDFAAQPSAISGNNSVCAGSVQIYSVSPVGGAVGYTWVVTGGFSGTSTTNSISLIPSASGILSVSATNICGTGAFQTLSVTVNSLPVISLNSGAICTGQSFTINPTGASTYTYSGGSNVVSPTSNTSYSVTGTSTVGCVSAAPAISNITVNALPVISVNSGAICAGQSFTINPAGANTYTYSGGSNIVSPTSNTNYSVTGTSTAGCVSAAPAISNVTVNALPVISVNSGAICTGQSFTVNPAGASTYTYSGGSNIVSPTSNTNYSITGTSTAGCVSAAPAISNVTVNSLPVISVNSGAICTGQSFTINPAGANTYTYSGGSNMVSPTSNTNYSITGTSTAGCVSAAPAISNVTVNALPVISVNSGTICTGQSFTINPAGANTYTYSGSSNIVSPTSNTNYSVSGTSTAGCVSAAPAISNVTVNAVPVITVNSGSICNGQSFSIVPSGAVSYTYSGGTSLVSPAANTTYAVTGTSSLGCVSATPAIVSVSVYARPSISVNSGAICTGQSFTINPSGANTYTFSGGSNIVSPTSNASYSVSGTSTAGCVSSSVAIASVTVNALPLISVNSGTICTGQSFMMIPSGASTYTYSGGSNVVSPTTNTVYSVTGTSSAGCVASSAAVSNVTVRPLPLISVNSGSICAGQSFTFIPSGASSYTYSGGSAVVSPATNTTYAVSGTSSLGCVSAVPAIATVSVSPQPVITVNSGAICLGQSFIIIPSGASSYTYSAGSNNVSPTTSTVYAVTGTSGAGCVSASPALSNVTVNPIPVVSVNSGSICLGKSYILVASGASTYTYSGGSATVSPVSNSSYSVSGTSLAGCVSSVAAIANVTVMSLPIITVNSGSICVGKTFTIMPAGATTYTYSGGSSMVSPTANTSYTVSGTNSLGCVSAVPAIATISVIPLPTITVNSGSICSGQNFVLIPAGANSYSFSGGSSTVSPSTTTVYTVSGSNTEGCGSASAANSSVTVFSLPVITINSGSICNGQSFTLIPSGGITYTISGGSSVVSPTTTFNYSVTGTGPQGCVSATPAIATVTVNPLPLLLALANPGSICPGETGTLTVNGAVSYTWLPGGTTNSLVVSPSVTTVYTITGVSSPGCTNSVTVTQIVENCIGVEKWVARGSLCKLYPNPNHGEFTIENREKLRVNIVNSLGQVVLSDTLYPGQNKVTMTDHSKGIYYVILSTEKENQTYKVVKQ